MKALSGERSETPARKKVTLGLLALLSAVLLLGCSDDDRASNDGGRVVDGGGGPQEEALADGRASFEEYEAAVLRYVDCLTDAGYPPIGLRLDEATMLYDYRVVGGAVDSGADGACYAQELSEVGTAWMDSPARPRLPGEVRSVGEMLERCLERRDVPAPVGLPPTELEELVEEYGLTLDQCMQGYMAEVYPPE